MPYSEQRAADTIVCKIDMASCSSWSLQWDYLFGDCPPLLSPLLDYKCLKNRDHSCFGCWHQVIGISW